MNFKILRTPVKNENILSAFFRIVSAPFLKKPNIEFLPHFTVYIIIIN